MSPHLRGCRICADRVSGECLVTQRLPPPSTHCSRRSSRCAFTKSQPGVVSAQREPAERVGKDIKKKEARLRAADSGPVSSKSVSEAAHAGIVESSLTLTGADLSESLLANNPEAARTPAPKETLFRAETTRRHKVCTRIFCPPFPDVRKPRMWAEKKSTVSQTDICSAYLASGFILCSFIRSVGWGKKKRVPTAKYERKDFGAPNVHDCLKISLPNKVSLQTLPAEYREILGWPKSFAWVFP